MFEQFTCRARQVVVLAQQESSSLGHNYVGTEHLLLGLLGEGEGIGPRVLFAAGLRMEGLRAEVLHRLASTPAGEPRQLDADALATLGIDLDEVRRQAEAAFGPGALDRPRSGGRCWRPPRHGAKPFTPKAKAALEQSLRQAVGMRHRYIGTEHLLLGLLSVDGLANSILLRRGLTLEGARAAVLDQLGRRAG